MMTPPKTLLAILTLFTFLTLHQSATLPLGEAADETDHFQYLQFVAHHYHPPLTEAERDEAGYKGGLAPLYYLLTAWPITLAGENTPPFIRRTDQRPERFIPNDGLGFNRVMHTLDEAWPWRGQILAWHVSRFLSLPMAWATLMLIYALAWTWFSHSPHRQTIALSATLFTALLPRFIISSAVINDDNLVFALSAAILLLQLHLLRGRTHLWGLLGAVFGLALITKYFSLILLPEILLTAALSYRHTPKRAWGWFFLTLLLTAGPWFSFIIIRFNRIEELGWFIGLAASLGEPQITNGLIHLFSATPSAPNPEISYPLPQWVSLLYRSFWYEYGWMQLFAPTWVYGLYTVIILISLPKRFTPFSLLRSPYSLLCTRLGLFLLVVITRYILSATLDTGQGRHLYPALPVMALLIGYGLTQYPRRFQGLLMVTYSGFSIWLLMGSGYISNAYQIIPVTTRPVTPQYPQLITMTDSIRLLGYDSPLQATAGDSLPVRLYWQASAESNQDYLLSLCLNDTQAHPISCWVGQFANGHYPARAWEAHDTLIDTVFIPLPVCYRLTLAYYSLHLTVWPLDPTNIRPTRIEPPLLNQTLPPISLTLKATDLLFTTRPQTVELWQQGQRLMASIPLQLAESITAIQYPDHTLNLTHATPFQWIPTLTTASALPCDEGQPIISHYISQATMPPGLYHLQQQPEINLNFTPRQRTLTPFTATITFDHQLAPLTWQINEAPPQAFTPTPSTPPISLDPQTPLNVTIQWHARQWQPEPLIVALKLLDKDFALAGERVARLGDRYPNVLWHPTELVAETYPIFLNPAAPPGLYQLEVSLIQADSEGYTLLPVMVNNEEHAPHLYPFTFRLLDRDQAHPPTHPLTAQLGTSIELQGYDLELNKNSVHFALYWHNQAKLPQNYTVFTQLIGPDNQVWAQWDNPPQAGRYPTTAWAAPDKVIDRYTLTLREGAPPGVYRLLVGMYDPQTGQRLPLTVQGQPQPDQALLIQTLTITP